MSGLHMNSASRLKNKPYVNQLQKFNRFLTDTKEFHNLRTAATLQGPGFIYIDRTKGEVSYYTSNQGLVRHHCSHNDAQTLLVRIGGVL